jgi:peptide/nickel transport system substrate-binding protein
MIEALRHGRPSLAFASLAQLPLHMGAVPREESFMTDRLSRQLFNEGIDRRSLLKGAGAGALALGSAGLLGACGAGSSSTHASAAAGVGLSPVHGGTLIVGAEGGANTDTLDADNGLTNTDFARLSQLYDALIRADRFGRPQLAMAADITPNKNATVWTVKLRPGIKCHDGTLFRASDVLYTYNRILKNNFAGKFALGPLDIAQSSAPDATTVKLVFSRPYSVLLEALSLHYQLYLVPSGYNPKKPIGTGPFKLVSFSPGQSSTVVRFDDYWDQPLPYLDKVVTTNIADETAQVNGLLTGQFQAIDFLTAASLSELDSSSNVKPIISNSAGFVPFTMRLDRPPFNDNRVRLAFKLIVDRPQYLNSIFAGHGRIGNDMFSIADPLYDADLFPQRVQDLEQARSLLKAAGHEGLTTTIITTPNAPGMVQAAEVLATQAVGAGVKVNVVTQTTTNYFAQSYLKVPFSQDYWQYTPYLMTAATGTIAGAPFNTTHQADPAYDKLYTEATSTLNSSLQRELVHEMMRYDHEEGGWVIPFFFPVIDAVASNVYGVEPALTALALDTYSFQNFWMKD